MVSIIIEPPWIVSKVGCSLMNNHTQIGPMIVSSKKNRLTSAADINLGAIVTKTKGKATHITHIKGTIIKSISTSAKLFTKDTANIATRSLPITAAGTKSLFFADQPYLVVPVTFLNYLLEKNTVNLQRKEVSLYPIWVA